MKGNINVRTNIDHSILINIANYIINIMKREVMAICLSQRHSQGVKCKQLGPGL